MGKKISQSSVKICRNEKQLHSLIQVLRPKVYITDISSFKRLVQQLTGNNITGSSSSSPDHPTKPDRVVEDVSTTVDTKESSMELASSAPLDHDDSCALLSHHQITLEDPTVNPDDDHVDMLAYRDLESWLLEMDQPFPFYHDCAPIQQEVSIYDYELSGLI